MPTESRRILHRCQIFWSILTSLHLLPLSSSDEQRCGAELCQAGLKGPFWGTRLNLHKCPPSEHSQKFGRKELLSQQVSLPNVARDSETQGDTLRQSPSRNIQILKGGKRPKTSCLEGHGQNQSGTGHTSSHGKSHRNPVSAAVLASFGRRRTYCLIIVQSTSHFFRSASPLGFRLGTNICTGKSHTNGACRI